MRGVVENVFSSSWSWFVGSPEASAAIQGVIKGVGVLYLLSALAVYSYDRLPRFSKILLFLGGGNLLFLAFLQMKEHFFYLPQFFEYGLQFSSPFFLLYYWREKEWSHTLVLCMKLAIAVTFVSHGLFAIGFYPRPAYFVEMAMRILGLDQAQAIQFLKVAGVLDFVVSILLFLPGRVARTALTYAIFWGFATTMARIAAHFYPELWTYTLTRWVHESLFRFPHFLIPLLVLLLNQLAERKEGV